MTLINKAFGTDWSAYVKFDTKAAEGGDAHPEGTWDAVVVNAEAGKSRKGHEMITATFKTSQGKIKNWFTYMDEYPWMFLKPLYALGLDKAYFDAGPSMEDIAVELLKRRGLIDVIHEEYKGKPSAKIKSINAIPDNGIKADAPEAPSDPADGEEPF